MHFFNESISVDTSDESTSMDETDWPSTFTTNYTECDTLQRFHMVNMTYMYTRSEIEKMFDICSAVFTVRHIGFWSTLVIGIPGNILALLTILTFPRSIGTFFLALLSFSDLVAIIMKLINVVMVTFKVYDTGSCKLIILLTEFTSTFANWVLILICFERMITVLFPLKKNYYCTMRRAHQSAIILAIILVLIFSVDLWIVTAGPEGCITSQYEFYSKWTHVVSTLYSYLPSVLLLIMVFIIWRTLMKIQQNRDSVFCADGETGNAALTKQRLRGQAKTERSITIMLLFASVTFIILTLPLCVALAVNQSGVIPQSQKNILYLELVFAVATGFVTLSHAVNFFIYLVSTKRFRTHVMKLLKRARSKGNNNGQERTNHTIEDHL